MLLVFENILLNDSEKKEKKREPIWNTNRPGGWDRYFSLTNVNRVFDTIAEEEGESSETIDKRISKELTSIKFKAFGKVSVKKRREKLNKTNNLEEDKERLLLEDEINDEIMWEIEDAMVEVLHKDQKKNI